MNRYRDLRTGIQYIGNWASREYYLYEKQYAVSSKCLHVDVSLSTLAETACAVCGSKIPKVVGSVCGSPLRTALDKVGAAFLENLSGELRRKLSKLEAEASAGASEAPAFSPQGSRA